MVKYGQLSKVFECMEEWEMWWGLYREDVGGRIHELEGKPYERETSVHPIAKAQAPTSVPPLLNIPSSHSPLFLTMLNPPFKTHPSYETLGQPISTVRLLPIHGVINSLIYFRIMHLASVIVKAFVVLQPYDQSCTVKSNRDNQMGVSGCSLCPLAKWHQPATRRCVVNLGLLSAHSLFSFYKRYNDFED
ncbi:unnamed protein product [Dovyalis caffra]|uniref:Uncharacterized protein n=1 Tax=Dovyalis caffra TaxID=77055 RepID=A0AAV1QWA4_9ROSI|nr:unnamed protein product [Dovyalis caffra]